MAIYTIADLHLSFENEKPMNIFGDNWSNHAEKIKASWISKVKQDDYVILPGDFSWETYLEDTTKDFDYLNKLPGKKILLKGNHDYWWTTVTNMKNFFQDKGFENIYFLYNNSYCIENKIIAGTRGWNVIENESHDNKMIKREAARLALSIEDGIKNYGTDKEIIAFFHYPPITLSSIYSKENNEFINTLKKYNVKRCYYGHLHGRSHKDAVEGEIDGITYKLISADYLNFELVTI